MSFVSFFDVDEDELTLEDVEHRLPWVDREFDELAHEDLEGRPSWAGRHRPVSPIGHHTWPFKAGPDPVPSSSRQAWVSGPATSSDRKAA